MSRTSWFGRVSVAPSATLVQPCIATEKRRMASVSTDANAVRLTGPGS